MEELLIKCNECREKLNYIKNYMEENDVREQIELDYLKKIRIKTRKKSVLIAIGIIVFKKEEAICSFFCLASLIWISKRKLRIFR